MPKLGQKTVEKNQVRIERAALRLFIRQGFHGTAVREIAEEAGVSLGNIYNYYPNKDALYRSIVKRYAAEMAVLVQSSISPLLGRYDSESLKLLAAAVRETVYSHPDYWRLMYIDVTEFGNRHFAHSFRNLSSRLAKLALADPATTAMDGIDSRLALTSIYLQFFMYFLIEKLFGGKQHLGVPEEAALEQMIRIFTRGICSGPGANEKVRRMSQ
jgi:AcrR family transcriptional regulator